VESLQASTEQRYDPKRRNVADEETLVNSRVFGYRTPSE
jgi:hypothetical protein